MLVLEVSIVAAVLPMAAVTEGARHLTRKLVRLLLARVPAGVRCVKKTFTFLWK